MENSFIFIVIKSKGTICWNILCLWGSEGSYCKTSCGGNRQGEIDLEEMTLEALMMVDIGTNEIIIYYI
jgi:hypothetical protein